MENRIISDRPKEFRGELQISPRPVLAFLSVLAVLFLVFTGRLGVYSPNSPILAFRLGLYVIVLLGWLICIQSLPWTKVFLVISSSVYIFALLYFARIPEAALLGFIPVVLAAAMFGPWLGLALGGLITGLIILPVLLGSGLLSELTLAFSMISIWGTVSLMFSLYSPIYQIGDWVWRYYNRALELVEETDQSRMELNGVLEELTHLNKQLALANEKQLTFRIMAEEAEKTKAAFVAKVSHELRTPLNMIIGLVNLMIDNPQIYGRSLPKTQRDDLMIIQRNCDHLTSMINDVLALSHAESGRLTLNREYVSIKEVVEQVFDVVSPLINKKGLETIYSIPDDLPQIYCDRTRIRQVLLNLVSNAARFTETGGIYVKVEDGPHYLLVSVRDTGPGVAKEDTNSIFDPFCQGSSTHLWRDKGGTGLGLTISKQFIELHGGKIWLESELGHGTTFFFNLPKEQTYVPQAAPQRWIDDRWDWVSRLGKPISTFNLHQSLRVVVLDRENALKGFLSTYKERLDFTVNRDVEGLLEEIKRAPANLVLVNAPTLAQLHESVEVIRKVVKDTPIVGWIIPDKISPLLENGVVQLLVKPVTQRSLVEAIHDLPRPVRQILIIDDDIEISDLYIRMLQANDPEVKITAVTSGKAAFSALEGWKPDLILLDITIPDMDGYAILERKNSDPTIQNIPVVIASAVDLRENSLESQMLLVTMAEGLSPSRLLECSVGVAEILFKSETQLDRVTL